MVVRSFDGPTGHLEQSNIGGPRRYPSHPGTDSDDSSGSAHRKLPVTSGLGLPAVGGAVGQDYRSPLMPAMASKFIPPGRASASPSKQQPTSHAPRYNLKTIPPKRPNPVSKHLRPGAQHVPGSYRSEVIPSSPGSIGQSTSSPSIRPASEDRNSTVDSSYFGPNNELSSSAAETSKQAITYDASPAASSMRQISISQVPKILPAEPILTFGVEHGHSHNGSPASSSTLKSDHRDGEFKGQVLGDSPSLSTCDKTRDGAVLHAEEVDVLFKVGPQISEMLFQSPPLAQEHADDLGSEQLSGHPSVQSMSSLEKPYSKHGEPIPISNTDVSIMAKDPSQLPESTERGEILEGKYPEVNAGTVKINERRSTDLLSNVSHKLSFMGRSLSSLSGISFRSDARSRSLQSSNQQEKIDPANEEPRKHWMSQILGKGPGSTVTRGSSNLTARPSHSQRQVVEAAARPSAVPKHTSQFPPGSTDETSVTLQQQKNAESFARVIVDLELLLKEALIIAHEAAGENHSDSGHAFSELSEKISGCGAESSDGSSINSPGHDEEDNYTRVPPRLPLRVSSFRNATPGDGIKEEKNGFSENSPPRLEAISETQPHHMQGASEPNVNIPVSPEPLPASSNVPSSYDWAYHPVKRGTGKSGTSFFPQRPVASQTPTQEQQYHSIRARRQSVASDGTVHHHVVARQAPQIQPRISSVGLRSQAKQKAESLPWEIEDFGSSDEDSKDDIYVAALHGHKPRQNIAPQTRVRSQPQGQSSSAPGQVPSRRDTIMSLPDMKDQADEARYQKQKSGGDNVSLTNRHHFSIREPRGLSLSRSHRRAPIARDWSTSRKRYVATVACISTALMGLIIGIYAGEVPAIQYAIVDEHHYTILGNVVFFIGLAITTSLFWPLPLLHGRKPYTLAALAILLPLQFPQALAVGTQRSSTLASYRVGLLLPRAISGLIMGFANINFKSTLLDLFGASLQSVHPHQELVNANDVRRHGGGMGIWLGIWTWCYIGSLGVGFLIGAIIISGLNVSWGFWITIILTAAVLLLNVLVPEVRRSSYRRSMAEVRTGADVSRRVARGEVKMHLQSTGPIWWWEEVWAGHVLCIRMLKQPGFMVLSLYLGWIYGQIVIVIVVCLTPGLRER